MPPPKHLNIMIETNEVSAYIRETLRMYIGAASGIIDLRLYLIGMLELVLLGRRYNGCSIHSLLQDIGNIPTDIRDGMDDFVKDHLLSLVHSYVLPDLIDYSVSIDFLYNTTVRLTFSRLHQPQVSSEDYLYQDIHNSLDNGDWCSEKLRRLVGM